MRPQVNESDIPHLSVPLCHNESLCTDRHKTPVTATKKCNPIVKHKGRYKMPKLVWVETLLFTSDICFTSRHRTQFTDTTGLDFLNWNSDLLYDSVYYDTHESSISVVKDGSPGNSSGRLLASDVGALSHTMMMIMIVTAMHKTTNTKQKQERKHSPNVMTVGGARGSAWHRRQCKSYWS